MLIGNVGKDPEVRYFEADQAVAQLTLATTERGYTLQNGTRVPDHTDWHNIVFYRGLAKVVEKYVHKGDITDVNAALFVKSLKNTSNNPRQGNWKLMMKNVYELSLIHI